MSANGFGFDVALQALKRGAKARRLGWNGQGQWLEVQVPDENSKMSLPYIYISTVTGDLVPWLASQTDLLANDWQYMELDADAPTFISGYQGFDDRK